MRYRTMLIDVGIDFEFFSEIVINCVSVIVIERARCLVDNSFNIELQRVSLQRMRGQTQELIET